MSRNNDTSDIWQGIYCALMLIVIAFFLFLISFSRVEKEKMRSFTNTYKMEAANAEPQEQSLQNQDGWEKIAVQLEQSLRKTTPAGIMDIQRIEGAIKLTFRSDLLFGVAEAKVKNDFHPLLDEVSRLARENDLVLVIEGHTDNQPVKSGRFSSNWELSVARAVNVMRYLGETGGIPFERLFAAGFGEYRAVADNDIPGEREKNRRVEIKILLPRNHVEPGKTSFSPPPAGGDPGEGDKMVVNTLPNHPSPFPSRGREPRTF